MADEKNTPLTTMWLEYSSLHLSSAVLVWYVTILHLKANSGSVLLRWKWNSATVSSNWLSVVLTSQVCSTGSLKFPSIVISSCGNSYPIKVLHQFFSTFTRISFWQPDLNLATCQNQDDIQRILILVRFYSFKRRNFPVFTAGRKQNLLKISCKLTHFWGFC